ncbi:MAG: response regulator [Desulfovibrio sp.]|jgi:PAS domain S-box-containing protein
MRRRSEPPQKAPRHDQEPSSSLREKLIGLGESSVRKSYYPELQARLQQLQRFRAILDQSNDAIFLLDLQEGFIVDFNRMVCDLAGCDEDHVPTKPFFEIFPDPKIKTLIQNLTTEAGDHPHVTETEVHSTRGQVTPVEISARSVRFSGVEYAVVVARDITQRRRAEQALQRQRELDATLAHLSERLLRPISLNAIAGHVLTAAARLTDSDMGFVGTLTRGGARLQINAFHGAEVHGKIPSPRPSFEPLDGLPGAVLQNGTPVLSNDAANDHRAVGVPSWHQPIHRFLGVPALAGTRVIGIIALANAPRNYTEADREAVERLAVSFALAVQRKQFEQDVLAAKEAAETASRSKSEFLANMSHEIRTPLNGVLGMLQILKDNDLDEENKDYVDVALRSGNGLLSLLDDLLSLSTIEAGRLVIREQIFALPDLLDTVVQLFRSQAAAKGIALRLVADPALPRVLTGDAGRLRQILFNLVGNAVKFTSQGEVTLEVSTAGPPDENGWQRLLFVVEDTGIGIPENQLDRIWDVFTQVDGSSTRKHEGTGLGLHLVRRLTNALLGSACIDSRPGQGTQVHVCLGFAPAEERSGDALPPLERQSPTLRVLLAEDEQVNRLTAQRFLERLGHVVDIARNGREALNAVNARTYDVVLMDIQMPEMDGVAATRAIRASTTAPDPDVPIVALTAHALDGDRERFLAAGMNEHLAKPLNMQTLERTLQRLAR